MAMGDSRVVLAYQGAKSDLAARTSLPHLSSELSALSSQASSDMGRGPIS